eukprot:TRINITY_DN8989_c0_g1_i1.p1 TRINITY_DN8989_c0_g1~~TRINITY_DN8989_c0_g1_i1.p1  ORF type:complete len:319 (+),score=75.65 TRINITY_DN8989_c0_g1_i1:464-1420(+)
MQSPFPSFFVVLVLYFFFFFSFLTGQLYHCHIPIPCIWCAGIGREIALMCAEYGARVIGLDVTEKPLEGGRPTVEEFAHRHSPTETTCGTMDKDVVAGYSSGTCGEVVFVCGDTTRAEDCAAAVAMAVEKWGRLDVWVNNAAIGSTVSGRLTELSEDEWRRVLEVDVTGYMLGTRAAVRQFLCQEVVTSTMARGDDASGDGPRVGLRGRVINIGSQHGMVACPGDLAYGVGKAAAVYMARQVAVDYATEGIACNAISPGKVLTGHDTDHRPYSLARTPCTRLGVPRDIAAAVLFLCSPLASEYLTGSNLVVDGGWMAY